MKQKVMKKVKKKGISRKGRRKLRGGAGGERRSKGEKSHRRKRKVREGAGEEEERW